MIRKFLSIISVLIICLSLFGCKDTTPRILLSTNPVTKETFVPMNEFKKNDTINFVLIAPKGFKSQTVRMSLLKKNFLSPLYGDTLALGRDFNVENNYYLIGSFTVYSGGRYALMFYDSDGTKKKTHFPAKQYYPKPDPLVYAEFGVYD